MKCRSFLAAVSFLLLSASVLSSRAFFADDDMGNDGNPGTFLSPYLTIQRAANAMMTNTARVTCFVYPGEYPGKVLIRSNRRSPLMVFTRLSNTAPNPVMNGGMVTNFGFKITNAGNIILSDLDIKKYGTGIILQGFATNNIIRNNSIFSNGWDGILIDSENADRNTVFSNTIYSTNGSYTVNGIFINDADNNIVRHNLIRNNSTGILLQGNPAGNHLAKNIFYSNENYGIHIIDVWERNMILTNHCWGSFNAGFYVYSGSNTVIKSNRIHHNLFGIMSQGGAWDIIIAQNRIFSNSGAGITLTDNAKNPLILSNIIYGADQDYGISLGPARNARIYRNLVCGNEDTGIHIQGASTNARIIHNTIFRSIDSHGVSWANTSSGTMINNIILSNGNGAGEYGIFRTSSQPVYVSHNCVYGNFSGPTNGGFIWGSGNIFQEPMIETVSSFTIISALSPVVDAGTNIPGVSGTYAGSGPDMGWREWGMPPAAVSTQNPSIEETLFFSLDGVVVAPDPVSVKKQGEVVFFNLTKEFEIRVYTPLGGEVKRITGKSLSGRYYWDLKNSKNEKIRPGPYICRVVSPSGEKKDLKLVVLP